MRRPSSSLSRAATLLQEQYRRSRRAAKVFCLRSCVIKYKLECFFVMSEAKVLFNTVEDEKLVDLVKKYPCIYDAESPVYKDQILKENTWKEIGEVIKRSAQDCKKRWRNIKDTYRKRQKKGKATGRSALSKGKKWALADMLTFLDKEDHRQESMFIIQTNDMNFPEDAALMEDTVAEDVDAASQPQDTSVERRKRRRSSSSKDQPPSKHQRLRVKVTDLLGNRCIEREKIRDSSTNQNQDDDIDLFFKSIAMSVKKMRPDLIHEAKMRSLQMIVDLESRCTLPIVLPPAPTASSTNSYMTSPSPSSSTSTNHTTFSDSYDYKGLESLAKFE